MRFLLTLLAILGLLANPVSASAARAACGQAMAAGSISGAHMPGTADTQHGGVKASNAGKAHRAKGCAQLCAGIGAVDVAAEAAPVSVPFVLSAADHAPARVASVHPFEPAGADRPPRHIA